jgi:hypothetical protein
MLRRPEDELLASDDAVGVNDGPEPKDTLRQPHRLLAVPARNRRPARQAFVEALVALVEAHRTIADDLRRNLTQPQRVRLGTCSVRQELGITVADQVRVRLVDRRILTREREEPALESPEVPVLADLGILDEALTTDPAREHAGDFVVGVGAKSEAGCHGVQ